MNAFSMGSKELSGVIALADTNKKVLDELVTEKTNESKEMLNVEFTELSQNINDEFANLSDGITQEMVELRDTIGNGSPKGVYNTLAELNAAFPNGTVGIYVVLETGNWYYWDNSSWVSGGNYQSTGISDDSINPKKTTFAELSPNLFDKSAAISGYTLNVSTGEMVASAGYYVSDWIPVEQYTQYKRNHNAIIVFYNSNKVYTNGFGGNTIPVSSGGGNYARVAFLSNLLDTFQLEKGNNSTTYKPYGVIDIKDLYVEKKNLSLGFKQEFDNLENAPFRLNDSIYPYKKPTKRTVFDLITVSDALQGVNADVSVVNYGWGSRSKAFKLTSSAAANAYARFTPSSPISVNGVSALSLIVYIEDVSKISSVQLQIGTDASGYNWQRAHSDYPSYVLKNGWNIIRWQADSALINNWDTVKRVQVLAIMNSASSVIIGSVVAERWNKAQLIFVEDSGYQAFWNIGMPDLHSRNIPITWALTPGRLGVGDVITESQIDTLAEDSLNAFSFHSWISKSSSLMTVKEFRDDAVKCLRWLRKKGLLGRYPWRAAITQNAASVDQVNTLNDLVESYSSYESRAGQNCFPFIQPRGFARHMLELKTQSQIQDMFDTAKKTHGILVVYTHGIGTGLQYDVTKENWDYFISCIDTGISEGWLEGTTYDTLRAETEWQGGYGLSDLVNQTR